MPHLRSAPAYLLIAAFAVLFAACASTGQGSGAVPLRVLVYNIHAGKDVGGVHNLERVAEVVRGSGADLVLLQEVDRGTDRSGREDQLSLLRRLTGFHGAFGRAIGFQGGEYGVAILSRWPIVSDTMHLLLAPSARERAGSAYEPRGTLMVSVAAPSGTIRLLNTHLDASAGDHFRWEEIGRVRTLADSLRSDGALVLVGGDLNAIPESRVVTSMAFGGWSDAWVGCGAGAGPTFPAREPVRRIDYLFLPPGVRCDSAAVLPSQASDHRALLLVLRVDR